jgi:enoyl-CoA hydratase
MSDEPIFFSVDAHVATFTLAARPVNALSRAMRGRLVGIFDELSDRNDVRAVILRSGCKVFCAGADLRDRPDPDEHGAFPGANRQTRATFDSIRECAKPVIAAVNGAAIGAGFGIAGACDVILAADDAYFSMTEINVGLAGGAAFLQGLLPRSTARRLLLTGKPITAVELARMGVVDCVPGAQLEEAAIALAREIASKSPTGIVYAKRSCNLAESMPAADAYKIEQQYTVELSKSRQGIEARRAFLEKRPAVFDDE